MERTHVVELVGKCPNLPPDIASRAVEVLFPVLQQLQKDRIRHEQPKLTLKPSAELDLNKIAKAIRKATRKRVRTVINVSASKIKPLFTDDKGPYLAEHSLIWHIWDRFELSRDNMDPWSPEIIHMRFKWVDFSMAAKDAIKKTFVFLSWGGSAGARQKRFPSDVAEEVFDGLCYFYLGLLCLGRYKDAAQLEDVIGLLTECIPLAPNLEDKQEWIVVSA